ncbi:MAG: ABC-F family ATP-binding cassette domain-containing protein [Bacteroidales bacterium]|nr:ABC-F family ATP-binding cassette domain-containing protein [Bacteroidales bacterium]MDD3202011.1 ABC-F family ATP-binding cassette domain-containing protein [Bacteroidales bacterium]
MASYLQVENISKSYGTKVLFDRISFNINEGDKIALIAPNGTGKSTLLSILAGKESSDRGGEIKFLKDISIAFLEQDYDYDPDKTVFDEVFSKTESLYNVVREYSDAIASNDRKRIEKALGEMDRLDGWSYEQQIKQILSSLHLTNLHLKMSQLSGGEVKRVAIAGLLLRNADFLVLDEPTNHLDIEIIEFLEEYLSKTRCTLFMVTHDRYFLDRVCNTILELDGGALYTYKGNYSFFLEKREERIANADAETTHARNLLRRELEWIRSTPCARTGKAKYRIDAFYDLQKRAEGRSEEKRININIQSARLGKKIINCSHTSFSYGQRCMLNDFTYNFSRFEKIGIVGNNGVGKSTFLKLMTGELQPTSGTIECGETIVFGHYRQEGISFKPDQTLFDVVHDIAETVTLADGNRVSVSTFLNYFLFPPNTHFTKVDRLSGGERRRLYLLTILMKNPNFLILDEPTNDLDIMTLNVLEEYLQNFPGCLMIVSHDRFFLDKLADHLFVFTGEGKVKDYVGKCSDYRRYMKELAATGDGTAAGKSSDRKIATKREEKCDKDAPVKVKLSYKEKKELESLEIEIQGLEEEKQSLEQLLSGEGLSIDEITKASQRIGEIIKALDVKEMRWLELDSKNE